MSRHGDTTFEWGDGEYTFRIGIREWEKLDEKCGVGPEEMLNRLRGDKWRVRDLVEVHRLGLEGGRSVLTNAGTPDHVRINRLVRDYVEAEMYFLGRPDKRGELIAGSSSKLSAMRIVAAALFGPEDDQPPKSKAEASEPRSFQEDGSLSPRSTDGDQSSAIRQEKSASFPSGNSWPVSLDT